MKWRGTTDYSLQAWILALSSMLSGLVGLGEIGFGIWLIVFTRDIAPLFGVFLMEVYYGYVAIGTFATLTALLGFTAALLRRMFCLMMFATLLGASMLFQGTVWAFIHIEQTKLEEKLVERISENPDYMETIDFHYNCQLQAVDNSTAEFSMSVEDCAEFVNRQLWTQAWAEISLCATVICLQFVIFVMSILMIELVRRDKDKHNQVHPRRLLQQEQARQQQRTSRSDSVLESDFTSSTAPFFAHSSSSRPPSVHRQLSLASAPVPSAPALQRQTSALCFSNAYAQSCPTTPISPTPSITKV